MTFSTTFPATENPLSEGGVWVDGAISSPRTSMQTGSGNAYGTMTTFDGVHYPDSCACLKGYPASHSAQGTLHNASAISGLEAELLVNATITSGTCKAYELDLVVSDGEAFLVRWNGPPNDFTVVVSGTSTNVSHADGAVWLLTSTENTRGDPSAGNTIVAKCNGATVLTHDTASEGSSKVTGGNPGMGAWNETGSSTNSPKFGWSDFQAAATVSYIQKMGHTLDNVNDLTSNPPTLTGVAAGNLLVFTLCVNDTSAGHAPPTTVIDSSGQTWTKAIGPNTIGGDLHSTAACQAAMYYLLNANAGTHTLSCSATQGLRAGSYLNYAFVEAPKCFALAGSSSGNGHSGTDTGGNTGATADPGVPCIAIAAAALTADTGLTNAAISDPATTDFTSLYAEQNSNTHMAGQHSYKEISTGALTASWTWTTLANDSNMEIIQLFKLGTGGVTAAKRNNVALSGVAKVNGVTKSGIAAIDGVAL